MRINEINKAGISSVFFIIYPIPDRMWKRHRGMVEISKKEMIVALALVLLQPMLPAFHRVRPHTLCPLTISSCCIDFEKFQLFCGIV